MADTKVLIHFDNSTTITDECGNTVTVTGTSYNTGQKKFGAGALEIWPAGGRISLPSTVINTSNDWTVEGWFRCDDISGFQLLFAFGNEASGRRAFGITGGSGGQIVLDQYGTGTIKTYGARPTPTSTYHHIAFVRSGNDVYCYVNGSQLGTAYFGSAGAFGNGGAFYIGSDSNGASSWKYYIDEVRFSQVARYTSNFTAPTAPWEVEVDAASGTGSVTAARPGSTSIGTGAHGIGGAGSQTTAHPTVSSNGTFTDVSAIGSGSVTADRPTALGQGWQLYGVGSVSTVAPTVSSNALHTVPVSGTASVSADRPTAVGAGGHYPVNTKALLHFDALPLVDSQEGNTITDTGTTLSTTTKKFGNSSAAFDGFTRVTIANQNLTSGAWTMEGWFYVTNSGNTALFAAGNEASGRLSVYQKTDNTIAVNRYGFSDSFVTTSVTRNAWHHIALTKDGSDNIRLFVDGVNRGQANISATTGNNNVVHIGRLSDNTLPMTGFVDEFRVSNVARYTTSDFTPQTAAFDTESGIIQGAGAVTTVAPTAAGTGEFTDIIAGAGSVDAPRPTAVASGTFTDITVYGTGSVSTVSPTALGASAHGVAATVAQTTSHPTVVADGVFNTPPVGTGSVTVARPTVAGQLWYTRVYTESLYHVDSTIVDVRSGNTSPFTSGTVTIDTTKSVFGAGSIRFDTTNAGILADNVYWATQQTSPWTFEGWWYRTTSATKQSFFHLGNATSGSYTFAINASDQIVIDFAGTGTIHTFGSAPSANVWHHIAFVRGNGAIKCYVDGVQLGTGFALTDGTSIAPSTALWIGTKSITGTTRGESFRGNADEIRISSTPRYTADFTVPTEAFSIETATPIGQGEVTAPAPNVEGVLLLPLLLEGDVEAPAPTVDATAVITVLGSADLIAPAPIVETTMISGPLTTIPNPTVSAFLNHIQNAGTVSQTAALPSVEGFANIPVIGTGSVSALRPSAMGAIALEVEVSISTPGGGSVVVPASTIRKIETWGAGGIAYRGGGGGGAYAAKNNLSITAGSTQAYHVGDTKYVSTSITGTYFGSPTTVFAQNGYNSAQLPSAPGVTYKGGRGGAAAESIGDVVRSGGNGSDGSSTIYGGGGGAATPTGDGWNGGTSGGVSGANWSSGGRAGGTLSTPLVEGSDGVDDPNGGSGGNGSTTGPGGKGGFPGGGSGGINTTEFGGGLIRLYYSVAPVPLAANVQTSPPTVAGLGTSYPYTVLVTSHTELAPARPQVACFAGHGIGGYGAVTLSNVSVEGAAQHKVGLTGNITLPAPNVEADWRHGVSVSSDVEIPDPIVSSVGVVIVRGSAEITLDRPSVVADWRHGVALVSDVEAPAPIVTNDTRHGVSLSADIIAPDPIVTNETIHSSRRTNFRGWMGETIVIGRSVTSDERERLEGYLAWKWNNPQILSAVHPYRWQPPNRDFIPPKYLRGEVSTPSPTVSSNIHVYYPFGWVFPDRPNVVGAGLTNPALSGRPTTPSPIVSAQINVGNRAAGLVANPAPIVTDVMGTGPSAEGAVTADRPTVACTMGHGIGGPATVSTAAPTAVGEAFFDWSVFRTGVGSVRTRVPTVGSTGRTIVQSDTIWLAVPRSGSMTNQGNGALSWQTTDVVVVGNEARVNWNNVSLGSGIKFNHNSLYNFGTSDFTIEFDISIPPEMQPYKNRNQWLIEVNGSSSPIPGIYIDYATGNLGFSDNSSWATADNNPEPYNLLDGNIHRITIQRKDGVIYAHVDGVIYRYKGSSGSFSMTANGAGCSFLRDETGDRTRAFRGNLHGVRVTKGWARYFGSTPDVYLADYSLI